MSFFNNVQENMIETAEQVIKVVEEGVAILTGGTLMGNENEVVGDTQYEPTYDQGGDDDLIIDEEDLSDMKSPLDSIADNVLGDLMKNQVRHLISTIVYFR